MYDVAIVGAGPAGIFSALEIVKQKPEWKVVIIEKGPRIETRQCLVRKGKKCPPCKTCNLLCGWGGTGAFSDGKLTLTPDVGGNLIDYIDRKSLKELISYTDQIYLQYGATETIYGTDNDSILGHRKKSDFGGVKAYLFTNQAFRYRQECRSIKEHARLSFNKS